MFSINSRGTEEYIGDQLISFNSETFQNNKKKYVNLIFDEKKEKLEIPFYNLTRVGNFNDGINSLKHLYSNYLKWIAKIENEAKKLNCKIITTIHDLIPIIYPHLTSFKHRLIGKYILPLSINNASTIISISHSTKNDIIKLCFF